MAAGSNCVAGNHDGGIGNNRGSGQQAKIISIVVGSDGGGSELGSQYPNSFTRAGPAVGAFGPRRRRFVPKPDRAGSQSNQNPVASNYQN